MHRIKVRVVEKRLGANNTIGSANRSDFGRAYVTVGNLMSAPGAGTTTLLARGLEGLAEQGLRVGVLEGDVQGVFAGDGLEANIKQVNHAATVMRVSAKTGEGIDAFRARLKELRARVAADAARARDHDHDPERHDHADHEHGTS